MGHFLGPNGLLSCFTLPVSLFSASMRNIKKNSHFYFWTFLLLQDEITKFSSLSLVCFATWLRKWNYEWIIHLKPIPFNPFVAVWITDRKYSLALRCRDSSTEEVFKSLGPLTLIWTGSPIFGFIEIIPSELYAIKLVLPVRPMTDDRLKWKRNAMQIVQLLGIFIVI